MNKPILLITLFLFLSLSIHGQERKVVDIPVMCDSIDVPISFRFNDDAILWDYRDNIRSLNRLDQLLVKNTIHTIDVVLVSGSASHEGSTTYNERLAYRRAESFKKYLQWKYPYLPSNMIHVRTAIDDGSALILAIEADKQMPLREQVIKILKSNTLFSDKLHQIKHLQGDAYTYIQKNLFPKFRSVLSCIVLSPIADKQLQGKNLKDSVTLEEDSVGINLISETHFDTIAPSTVTPIPVLPIAEDTLSQLSADWKSTFSNEITIRHLFAVKTNLLFDAATALNIEIEVPLGRRWSIAGEWIFPWWVWDEKQNCLEVLSGNLEGRYWLGDRNKQKPLLGWFCGLYTGMGLYDLEWNRKGYQGEFFVAAGVSGGYTHRIGRNLRMEYSLGIGYLKTKYRQYNAEFKEDNKWHLIRQKNGNFSWVGPTRAKISLVWIPSFKISKKGGNEQ